MLRVLRNKAAARVQAQWLTYSAARSDFSIRFVGPGGGVSSRNGPQGPRRALARKIRNTQTSVRFSNHLCTNDPQPTRAGLEVVMVRS
jgi:hypothetical protein